MNFTNPWGFLALFGIPIIVVLYILKQKFKTHEVGSMVLWNKILEQSDGHKWRQKLKRNLLMILEIAAVFLLTLGLARPFIAATGHKANMILVIDASLSMQATDEATSRIEKAKADASKLIENSPNEAFFTVVVFDDAPYAATTMTQEKSVALRAVSSIKAKNTGAEVEALKAVLKSLEAEATAAVYVFTDKNIDIGMEDCTTAIYGKPSQNYAIKLVSENDGRVLVKAAAYGGGEKCSVALFADGVIIDSAEVEFNGEEVKDVVFDVSQTTYNYLTAKITDTDILEADNVYNFARKNNSMQKVMLVTGGNIFLEKAISITKGVELYKKDPSEAENLSGYDLYIFDGALPQVLPTDGHLWVLNPPMENPFVTLSEEKNIGTTSFSGKVFGENISKLDFAAEKTRTAKTPDWAQSVVTSEDEALIMYGEKNSQKICIFTFDIHNTSLPLLKEFPILVYNILNTFVSQKAAGTDEIFAGGTVEISLLPKTVSAALYTPEGNSQNVDTVKGINSRFYETGIYKLVQSFEDGTNEEGYFAVNPVTEGESNMETGVNKAGNTSKGGIKTGKSLAPIIIFLALLVLGAEWWVNWRDN